MTSNTRIKRSLFGVSFPTFEDSFSTSSPAQSEKDLRGESVKKTDKVQKEKIPQPASSSPSKKQRTFSRVTSLSEQSLRPLSREIFPLDSDSSAGALPLFPFEFTPMPAISPRTDTPTPSRRAGFQFAKLAIYTSFDGTQKITLFGNDYDIQVLGEGQQHKVFQFKSDETITLPNEEKLQLSSLVLKVFRPILNLNDKKELVKNNEKSRNYLLSQNYLVPECYYGPTNDDLKNDNPETPSFYLFQKISHEITATEKTLEFAKNVFIKAWNESGMPVHDFKPDNLMQDDEGKLYFIDGSISDEKQADFVLEFASSMKYWQALSPEAAAVLREPFKFNLRLIQEATDIETLPENERAVLEFVAEKIKSIKADAARGVFSNLSNLVPENIYCRDGKVIFVKLCPTILPSDDFSEPAHLPKPDFSHDHSLQGDATPVKEKYQAAYDLAINAWSFGNPVVIEFLTN